MENILLFFSLIVAVPTIFVVVKNYENSSDYFFNSIEKENVEKIFVEPKITPLELSIKDDVFYITQQRWNSENLKLEKLQKINTQKIWDDTDIYESHLDIKHDFIENYTLKDYSLKGAFNDYSIFLEENVFLFFSDISFLECQFKIIEILAKTFTVHSYEIDQFKDIMYFLKSQNNLILKKSDILYNIRLLETFDFIKYNEIRYETQLKWLRAFNDYYSNRR